MARLMAPPLCSPEACLPFPLMTCRAVDPRLPPFRGGMVRRGRSGPELASSVSSPISGQTPGRPSDLILSSYDRGNVLQEALIWGFPGAWAPVPARPLICCGLWRVTLFLWTSVSSLRIRRVGDCVKPSLPVSGCSGWDSAAQDGFQSLSVTRDAARADPGAESFADLGAPGSRAGCWLRPLVVHRGISSR